MIVGLFRILDAPEAAIGLLRRHRAAALLAPILLGASLGIARTTAPAGAATITVQLPSLRRAAPPTAEMLEAEGRAILTNAAMPLAAVTLRPASPFVLTGSTEDRLLALRCLTQAVYYEAGYEPIEGRRAVAQVVLNRLRSSAFPDSVCGVIYQGTGTPTCQFTFVCTNDLQRPPAAAAWREAELVARAALSGYVERSVGEATHYHANYVAPQWAPLLAKVAVIGMHIFYEMPPGSGQSFTERYAGEPRDAATLRLSGLDPKLAAAQVPGSTAQATRTAALAYPIDALLDPPAAKPAGATPSAAVTALH